MSNPDPSNLLGLDYSAEASKLRALPFPIIDMHLHLNGPDAIPIFKRAADLYGIGPLYSMTRFSEMDRVKEILPNVGFIAMPDYRGRDPLYQTGAGLLEKLPGLRAQGVRIVKFWSAPRRIDLGREVGGGDFLRLNMPHLVEVMQRASQLGMIFMAHVADPDTWFATKYADRAIYGSKLSAYEPLQELLPRFKNPWIAAHMGGYPEDLDFLSRLLERHPNLYLDTSAAKWMVRELGKHPRRELLDFFGRWRGRILFGSDIVTSNEHLKPSVVDGSIASSVAAKASSPDQAFNLYASRYWLFRTMFESDYQGPSPVADPDLAMTEPERYHELDAPPLYGINLPDDLLYMIYHGAAKELLGL